MDVQRHHCTAGTAAYDHEVYRFRIQQDAGHDTQMDIGQVVIVFIAHADVVNRKTFLVCNSV